MATVQASGDFNDEHLVINVFHLEINRPVFYAHGGNDLEYQRTGFVLNRLRRNGRDPMAKLNYMVTESVRRLSQILVGFEIFEFPILCKVRNFFYRMVFDIGEKPVIGRQVRLYRMHGLTSGTIKIGRDCLLANHVEIDYSGGVTLEDHVWISDGG